MRAAIANAPVGDDVFGDDPTVHGLESTVAELLGKEAAMYVTSGTQSNLCAILAHCQRGDEYIIGGNAHAFRYEAGGAAVLGSVQPQTVAMLADGSLDLDEVAAAVKPDDSHYARSRLLSLENTHDGKVQTVAQMQEASSVARAHGLAVHLDGARLWNAAIALDVSPADLADPMDSVSVCLSKGLGAPVGSVLTGSAPFIHEARKWRKMLGGSLRQVGVIAAAGRYAIDHHRSRLIEDHQNAERLGKGLRDICGVEAVAVHTNMVFADLPIEDADALMASMADHNVLMMAHGASTRMITHLDVNEADIDHALGALTEVLAT
jgi:threonine aldolase